MKIGAQPVRGNGNWSDERVEKLKKLWDEGLTASQIATRMGGFERTSDGGRNAVIGKVHRLGLAGRLTKAEHSARVSSGVRRSYASSPERRTRMSQALRCVWAAKRALNPPTLPEPLPQTQEMFVPLYNRRQLLDLEDGQCRWIIGDPKHPDHHYCDQHRKPGLSYCEFHARKAYQPLPERTGRPLILPERIVKVA